MKLRSAAMLAAVLATMIVAAPASATVTLPPGTIPLPTSGSFLYLKSDPGEYIGQGQERLFTPASATIYASLRIDTFGAQITASGSYWSVNIAAPRGVPLAVGSYTGAERAVFRAVGSPGLDVYGESRGCNTVGGAFDVTELAISSLGDITLFDAVFEQHCEGLAPALYGRIRIESPAPASGETLPPGALTLPTEGSFFYQMWNTNTGSGAVEQLFTSADTAFSAMLTSEVFRGSVVQGDYAHWWYVDITAPIGGTLSVGRYPSAVRTMMRNAVSAGLDVYGDGVGCNEVSGWFDIDQIVLEPDGALRIFQSTFHFYCDNSIYQRHGRMRVEFASPPPPPPTLTVTLDPSGKVNNKTGVATISGTVTCSRSVRVDMLAGLTQVKPDHTTVQGGFFYQLDCVAPGVPWSQPVVGNGKFGASAASATVSVTNCEMFCISASTEGTIKLNSSK